MFVMTLSPRAREQGGDCSALWQAKLSSFVMGGHHDRKWPGNPTRTCGPAFFSLDLLLGNLIHRGWRELQCAVYIAVCACYGLSSRANFRPGYGKYPPLP